jgi:hypothetical protein
MSSEDLLEIWSYELDQRVGAWSLNKPRQACMAKLDGRKDGESGDLRSLGAFADWS